MKIEEAFGSIIKKHRKINQMSQEELAHEADLDRTFISLLERGRRNATLNTAFSIAKSFGIKTSDLIKELEEELNKPQ